MHGINYAIIGAGGTASHLIPMLVRYASAESNDVIHVWDADTVEEKNLKRQMFEYRDIGQPKAQVWADRYPIVSPHLDYVGEDNIERAVQEYDIVIICADNMAVRRLINDRALELDNITVINGGNEKHTGSVQMHVRRRGENLTPCIGYHSPELFADSADMATLSCAEIAQLPGGEQTMVANAQVAVLQMQALMRVGHVGNPKAWTKMTFDIFGQFQGSDVRMQGDDWA